MDFLSFLHSQFSPLYFLFSLISIYRSRSSLSVCSKSRTDQNASRYLSSIGKKWWNWKHGWHVQQNIIIKTSIHKCYDYLMTLSNFQIRNFLKKKPKFDTIIAKFFLEGIQSTNFLLSTASFIYVILAHRDRCECVHCIQFIIVFFYAVIRFSHSYHILHWIHVTHLSYGRYKHARKVSKNNIFNCNLVNWYWFAIFLHKVNKIVILIILL